MCCFETQPFVSTPSQSSESCVSIFSPLAFAINPHVHVGHHCWKLLLELHPQGFEILLAFARCIDCTINIIGLVSTNYNEQLHQYYFYQCYCPIEFTPFCQLHV